MILKAHRKDASTFLFFLSFANHKKKLFSVSRQVLPRDRRGRGGSGETRVVAQRTRITKDGRRPLGSSPASCLLLSKYDFYHFIGGEGRTADLLRQYAEKFYMMGEASMRRSIRKGSKWDGYKRNLLQEVSSPR